MSFNLFIIFANKSFIEFFFLFQTRTFYFTSFFIDLSDEYLFTLTMTTTNKAIQLHLSLKQLPFNPPFFNDVKCFGNLSKLYLNITELKFHLIWNENDIGECKQYKSSLLT